MSSDELGVLVPILAVGLSLSIPIVGMVTDSRKRQKLIEANHAERMAAIERGIELPPLPADILGGKRSRGNRSMLLPGLVWLFIGTAVLAVTQLGSAYWYFSRGNLLLAGAIPFAVGLAILIYHFAEGRKVHAAIVEQDKARLARTT